MNVLLVALLIVASFMLGRHAGFDSFLWFLKDEYPDVLDMLRDEMDKKEMEE